jgi:hypothetical protein
MPRSCVLAEDNSRGFEPKALDEDLDKSPEAGACLSLRKAW